ncbi:MAG: sigma-54 dependent transcriptional regulator [Fibrobacterota bacterium]
MSLTVLLVDDEPQFLKSAALTLRLGGFTVETSSDGANLLQTLAAKPCAVLMLDIFMPGCSGNELLVRVVRQYPQLPVIMLTALNEVNMAVECMRAGAFDYIVKPVEGDRLVATVRHAMEKAQLQNENSRLKNKLFSDRLENPALFEKIVTRNKGMIALFQYIEAVAPSPMPVLITGETGTGKEMIAMAVHQSSGRPDEFISINIAGLSDTLFCDTLFGHERGAFTGAVDKREGLVAKAGRGTVFLDEIGDLAMDSQVKLLRLLEERTYYPIGADSARTCDARVVVATNTSLEERRRKGLFRDDLYYRLESHQVRVPALRERTEDIPLLLEVFLEQAAMELGKSVPEIPPGVNELLRQYDFPGNIRELKNMVYDAVSQHKAGPLSTEPFQQRVNRNTRELQADNEGDMIRTLVPETLSRSQKLPTLKEAEKLLIDEALKQANGNQTVAAQYLGMSRSALNKRLIRSADQD